ncbi:RNA-directed DNA polymerase, eukaryota, reverse transcriptase zinc-binding domain protein [Tanacetum coccineum]|uniref:RNA-directed DNA polymerase, eukaryota, reverse transcriptase zinc-binding domain protein n=1 Tax=Tanacetum coccineum TaxID=301880 RepID=A0ABQ5EA11_9ASTR
MRKFMNKLKLLKGKIREWTKDKRANTNNNKKILKEQLAEIDSLLDKGEGNVETLNNRADIFNSLQDIDKLESIELDQKAKIKWGIEGDENTKYYHGILNRQRNQLVIRGVLIDGTWTESPDLVKNEFFSHFQNRFGQPQSSRIQIAMDFPNHLSLEQQMDLESNITREEIKRAVWDCGTDKSPGPDVLLFLKTYYFDWEPIQDYSQDFGKPPGSVLGDIVSDVQSAFVANRQILDGPFILNEIVQWCKRKNKQSMIFKVDFEKAYDSVRWDFLMEVLKKFGFGNRWCRWIQGCLVSSRGSVLVNGSPTPEFQFYKGLKQGDPLSPFLFLLIMESFHLSVQRVVDAGLFKGISICSSLQLSHLFYADDAIFMGQWSETNINVIVKILDCFHQASGLRINIHKSKIMGISVSNDKVTQAAAKVGCASFKTPFWYLGTKVGGAMSRIKSWEEIVSKFKSRLSKWKMKTLSIGGRMTLIKSVLSSLPIYHMSIYKVPKKIINSLESIRCHFFNGVDHLSKKPIWIKWKKVLAPIDKGGLGISSFYALNRALLFKWIWRFYTQDSSLWAKVIKGIHGEDGKIGKAVSNLHSSTWLDIVKEIDSLNQQGMNFVGYIHKKMGNGLHTYFWDDIWKGDTALKILYPRIYALETNKNISVASKLGQNNLGLSLRRIPRGGVEQSQLEALREFSDNTVLVDSMDRWSWSLEGSGNFSVASVRREIDKNLLPMVSSKTRWVNEVPKKVNIHAWKVKLDCLPTRLNISRRGMSINSILCPNCDKEVESSSHIFFSCQFAREIFARITSWWEVPFSEISSYN